jgi:hypothetical protein
MVQVAEEGADQWDGRSVSVLPGSPGTRTDWSSAQFAAVGLLSHFMPWTYPYIGASIP